jgi:hypothetical protein
MHIICKNENKILNLKILFRLEVVVKILLKSLTNLPYTDFVLCKCLLNQVIKFNLSLCGG